LPEIIETDGTCDEFCDEEELPSLSTMGKDLAKTAWGMARNFVNKKAVLLKDDEAKRRWDICSNCEFLVKKRCTKCGCFMQFKVHVSSADCPELKWNTRNNLERNIDE